MLAAARRRGVGTYRAVPVLAAVGVGLGETELVRVRHRAQVPLARGLAVADGEQQIIRPEAVRVDVLAQLGGDLPADPDPPVLPVLGGSP